MGPPPQHHQHMTLGLGACPVVGWACPAVVGWTESQQQDTPPAPQLGACPAESQCRRLRQRSESRLCGPQSSWTRPGHGCLSSLPGHTHAETSHTHDHQHTDTGSTTACCCPADRERRSGRPLGCRVSDVPERRVSNLDQDGEAVGVVCEGEEEEGRPSDQQHRADGRHAAKHG